MLKVDIDKFHPFSVSKWYYCWHHGQIDNISEMATATVRIPIGPRNSGLR